MSCRAWRTEGRAGAERRGCDALTGSGGRGNESCAGSGSARPSLDADEGSEGTDLARTAARGNAAKRQRSNLGQPALKVCLTGSFGLCRLSFLISGTA